MKSRGRAENKFLPESFVSVNVQQCIDYGLTIFFVIHGEAQQRMKRLANKENLLHRGIKIFNAQECRCNVFLLRD